MFEKAKPPSIASAHSSHVQDSSNLDQFSDWSGVLDDCAEATPLRTIEWSELTARLAAARDLRQLLREDAGSKLSAGKQGFANAAAQFFRACEEDERGVNPNALEARKASSVRSHDASRGGSCEDLFADEKCSDKSHSMRVQPSYTREEQ
ncbi:MAG: hypothetical protein ABJ205_09465 [Erythrobacter sp.]|uniref:hypothetical protein n=1 Tax=Erythrobacter sp. TaxID=1042 RepID=UPI003262EE2D